MIKAFRQETDQVQEGARGSPCRQMGRVQSVCFYHRGTEMRKKDLET